MSQYNLRYVPTLACNEFMLNGQSFNTQSAIIYANGSNVYTPALTTQVIINDATKNQALYANILTLEGEVSGNVNPNLVIVDARLTALEGNVSILQGNVIFLQSEINVINSNIANINANINGLNANTQYLHAPYNGLGGNTSYFTNGLQVWNGANETGNGIFSYIDGASPANQIRLSVQNAKGIFLDGGSTTIAPTSGGNVNITGSGGTAPYNFVVKNPGLLNANIRMAGDVEIAGNGNSSISIFTQPASLIPPSPAVDYVNIRGGGQAQVLAPAINVQADSSLNLQAGNGGTISLDTPSTGSTNSTINIGTSQGVANTGYQVITIGSGGATQARNSSTFLEGDNYLPYVAATNTGLWDGIAYVGLPTVYSGPLHGPLKTTYTPYVKSISTYFAGATVNSFVSTAGSFTVAVGVGSINLTCGAGGFLCSTGAGLLALTTLAGGITMTTVAGAISITTAGGALTQSLGAGAFTSTTGAGIQRLETGSADIQIASGYAPGGTAGDVVITAKGNISVSPDVGLYLEKVSHMATINNGTTPPGLPAYSLYTVNSNLYYNGTIISGSGGGVTQVLAGNGITVSPTQGTGVVTVSAIGSVVPPGGYLPVIGGNMVGDIYMKTTASSQASHIYQGAGAGQVKLYRPMSSYQAPFPSIGPPTYTGELLCFYNGDNNSPTQSNFTGWFPQSLVSAQPDHMTQLISGPASTIYSQANTNTPSAFDPNYCFSAVTLTNGVHITDGTIYISQIDTTQSLSFSIAREDTSTIIYTKSFPAGSFPSSGLFTFTLDYTHQEATGQYIAQWFNNNSKFSLMVVDPAQKNNWCGTLTSGTVSFYLMAVKSGTATSIFQWYPGTNTTTKVFVLDGSVYGIQEQMIATRYLYFYGLFNTFIVGESSSRVNNIFAYNVDSGAFITLQSDTELLRNPPIGTNGAVYGVEVDTTNDRTWLWGDFTYVGTNASGQEPGPLGDVKLNCGCDFTTTANWASPVMWQGVGGYGNCRGGKLLAYSTANYSLMVWAGTIGDGGNPQSFLPFNAIGMNYYNPSYSLWTVATVSCIGGGGGISQEVANIQVIDSYLFFTGSFNNGSSSGGTTCLSIMYTPANQDVIDASGAYDASIYEAYNSSDTSFWVDNGVQISVSNLRLMSNGVLVMNTNGYGLTNGGGVLTAPDYTDIGSLPTKWTITGMPRYSTVFIGGDDATKILLTCSLNQNNFFYSQTFDSTPSPTPTDPTVIAINGAKFLVDNTPMDKIVFAGSDQDYSSVSFIAGKVEDNDYNWYWQAQVGALNYYSGATLYANVSACPPQPYVPGLTTSTWGQVLINGNIASKSIDMSGFDIMNANTIYSANILTLSAPNAVEVGYGGRRVQPVLTVILNTLGNSGESDFGANNYIDTDSFAVYSTSIFQKSSLQGYFRFDDGMGGGYGHLTPYLYQVGSGTPIATGSSTGISFGSGQNYNFTFPNDVVLTSGNSYYFRFVNDGQSNSYYFYGWQSTNPSTVCSYAEAMVYAPVNDPLDFFNVYGNAFYSDRITSYGDIFFENPSTSLGANVLIDKTGMTLNDATNSTTITPSSIQQVNTANPGVSSDLEYYRLNMFNNLSSRQGQMTSATFQLSENPSGYANTNTMTIDGYRCQYYQSGQFSSQAQLIAFSQDAQMFLSASQLSGTPVGYSMTVEAPISGNFKLACATSGGPGGQKQLDITNTGQINITTTNASAINLYSSGYILLTSPGVKPTLVLDNATNSNIGVIFGNTNDSMKYSSNLSYNPSTKTLSCPNFIGNITGTLITASSIATTGSSANVSYNIPFVTANATTASQTVYTDALGHLTFNPSSNQLSASGTMTNNGMIMYGSASQILINNNSAVTPAILGANVQLVSLPLANITATTFTGNVSRINTTSDNTNGTYYIPFSKTTAVANTQLFLDDTTTALTYNPATSTITSGNIIVSASSSTNTITSSQIAVANAGGSFTINQGSFTGSPTSNPYVINGASGLRLQYNGTNNLSTTTNAVQATLLTSQGTATYSSPTLTIATTASDPYPTMYTNLITFSGSTVAQTISAITVPTNMPVNGMYMVYITNSNTSAGAITVNATSLGTGIKTTYTTNVVIPISGFALGTLTKVGSANYIWSINLVA